MLEKEIMKGREKRKKVLKVLVLSTRKEKREKKNNRGMKNYEKGRQKVRKKIIPGNTKSLWRAVNEAKNLNNQELPEVMYHGDVELKTQCYKWKNPI